MPRLSAIQMRHVPNGWVAFVKMSHWLFQLRLSSSASSPVGWSYRRAVRFAIRHFPMCPVGVPIFGLGHQPY